MTTDYDLGDNTTIDYSDYETGIITFNMIKSDTYL